MSDHQQKTSYRQAVHRSGSSLFLLELIIAVGFFAIAGVVCINMFLHAHRISNAAAAKTEAVRITQNCAESFIAADGDEERFASLLKAAFPDCTLSENDGSSLLLLDTEGGYQTELSADHKSVASAEENAGTDMNTLYIRVLSVSGEEVYHLEVRDLPGRGDQSHE